jgi:magnesium transporter
MDEHEPPLSFEELQEAWPVLSVAERIEGLRTLEPSEAESFFNGLSASEKAVLLIDMEPAERLLWSASLEAPEAAAVVQASAEPDRGLLLGVFDEPMRDEITEIVAATRRAPSLPAPPSVMPSDVTSAQMQIWKTVSGRLESSNVIEDGVWINMVNPSEREMNRLASRLDIEVDLLKAALDEEERPRIAVENGATLIIIDLPAFTKEGSHDVYTTIPLGIVLTPYCIVTVCLRGDTLIEDFATGRVKTFRTQQRMRFVLQILNLSATRYLRYLRAIDRASQRVEHELHGSLKNKELIQLLKMEKSLVYFSTSLRSNSIVLEKLLRLENVRADEEDRELLEDVLIENRQALEMANIYSDTLSSTMDAFASVISNNLNIVMKVLTSVTIVMAIPTMVSSFFGMNVAQPLQGPYAFAMVLGISGSLCLVAVLVLWRNRLL